MNQLTRQEWDALSAYLDNALNNRERQRLETQLQSRSEMRVALNELRQTRQLLRQTPVLRVPRNFTLTSEMAGLRSRRSRAYPTFQLAFALASFFFVLVIAGELVFGSPAAFPDTNLAMAPQAEGIEESAPEEPAAEEIPAEAAEDAAGTGPDSARIAETPSADAEEGEVALPPDEATPQPDPMESFQVVESPTLTPEAMTKNAPETEGVEEEPLQEMPLGEAPPQEEFASEVPAPQAESDVQTLSAEPSPEPSWWSSPWRLLQVIFGAAVVVSGLGLFLLQRRS